MSGYQAADFFFEVIMRIVPSFARRPSSESTEFARLSSTRQDAKPASSVSSEDPGHLIELEPSSFAARLKNRLRGRTRSTSADLSVVSASGLSQVASTASEESPSPKLGRLSSALKRIKTALSAKEKAPLLDDIDWSAPEPVQIPTQLQAAANKHSKTDEKSPLL
ncbi:MAG: hypothetical protein RIR70_1216 [Pseudomonadota bacterium]|jgi:hypothetical protein